MILCVSFICGHTLWLWHCSVSHVTIHTHHILVNVCILVTTVDWSPHTHSQQINNTPESYTSSSIVICHYGSQVTSCGILLMCAVSVSGDIPQPGTRHFCITHRIKSCPSHMLCDKMWNLRLWWWFMVIRYATLWNIYFWWYCVPTKIRFRPPATRNMWHTYIKQSHFYHS